MATNRRHHRWHLRAPRFLVMPHLDVMHTFRKINGFVWNLNRLRELDFRKTKGKRFQIMGVWIGPAEETVPPAFARALVDLRDACLTADAAFAEVEEEFGAIAVENTQLEFGAIAVGNTQLKTPDMELVFRELSWHAVVLEVAGFVLKYGQITLSRGRNDRDRVPDRFEDVTTEDVLGMLREHEHSYCELFAEGIELSDEWNSLEIGLEQEMFRAWKRRFPDDSESYETLSADSEELKRAAEDRARVSSHTWAPEHGWGFVPGKYSWNGNVFPLSGIVWLLLGALVESKQPLTMDELQAKGWPEEDLSLVAASTVRKHLSDLRSKLRENLIIDKNFDPIPRVDRGDLSAWEINSDLR